MASPSLAGQGYRARNVGCNWLRIADSKYIHVNSAIDATRSADTFKYIHAQRFSRDWLYCTQLRGRLDDARTPSGTFIGILNSQTAQDDIINHFGLLRVYHCKLYVDARMILKARTTIVEDKKSGIISISVMDRDREQARDITEAYIEELDKLINRVSTSSARRERIFLEERIKSVKSDLDASSLALSQFSSRNATLDPQKQGEATVEAAGNCRAS